jgi:hypothetical protein
MSSRDDCPYRAVAESDREISNSILLCNANNPKDELEAANAGNEIIGSVDSDSTPQFAACDVGETVDPAHFSKCRITSTVIDTMLRRNNIPNDNYVFSSKGGRHVPDLGFLNLCQTGRKGSGSGSLTVSHKTPYSVSIVCCFPGPILLPLSGHDMDTTIGHCIAKLRLISLTTITVQVY